MIVCISELPAFKFFSVQLVGLSDQPTSALNFPVLNSGG